MPRKPRTTKELREASSHLFYEFQMLVTLARGMQSGICGTSSINNAVLEAFGIHVRALIWFFYSSDPRDDDVVAEDFLSEPHQWSTARPPLTPVLDRAKQRAGKEIAHLTYARLGVTAEQKLWEFMPIATDIDLLLRKFLELVPETLLGEHMNELRRLASDTLPP